MPFAMPFVRPTALLVLACATALVLPPAALAQKPARKKEKQATPEVLYAQRPEALRFADDLAERRGLDREWVRQAIGQARFLPQVPRLMLPAPRGTAKNWTAYRARFVEPVRIRAGVRFWNEHADTLARAEREYGVPAAIIVGILGVETLYGQHMGGFSVMDALATLAFDFPAAHPRATERQAFFRGELEQFLTLADRVGTDPFALRGSYAGAMGMGQFMPTSWARWAVDFDGDGRIDLFNSPADAIGSVANYFQAHGWVSGLPTHYAVAFDEGSLRLPELLAPDILPSFTAAGMQERGARPLPAEGVSLQPDAAGPLALIELQNGSAPAAYVAGTRNFYVVTRYNWSSYYAMAVIELGREVAAAR
ncbi:lytic murein transglycosylase B [Paracidovorax avenae]|uniref:lytic murein transglycosylase B n=1 Tax=Paracidovorax avenae TaxID=80867 RepID=UPI000D1726B5|nr:lytic murein transglycosylase B [Paracidovorax avenae]AVS85491.1 lytic murein transglycosylase B [Paracidovorax avenae]AVS88993.1 lytic murein transglycosylase B [Paracidovorax avenae]AVS96340.1 lytic murein transglycosylase B [Paracidovorax avenae]AVT03176.1 lytic murein transglycosylase B [Paracidovorax avenae]AVT10122.1 lytic murein transglycosylase B [Paracidovorax avenae]